MAKQKVAKGRGKRVRRRLIAAGLVFLILYIGAHLVSRTEGVREMVADKISNGTRLPVTLEHCGATPLLGLRLKGVSIPGAELPEIKLSFNWLAFLSQDKPVVRQLRLEEAKIRFRRIPTTGGWEPLVLQGVASRLGAVVGLAPVATTDDALPVFPAYAINRKTLLQLEHTQIVWVDEHGNELASIKNADFAPKEKRLTDRRVVQTLAECDQIALASGRVLDHFRLEVVYVEGCEWVTVLEMSDADGEYPPFATPTLWQDLSLQLNRLSAIE
jgi:hypothetical protein